MHLAALAVYPLVMLVLVFVAQYRARRYRLSRIRWRGIRFAQDGSSLRYALLGLGWGTVSLLTLGIAYPLYRTRLQRYRATHTSFGTQGFRFDGRAVELMKAWLVAWLLLLPSLGLSYVWYRASGSFATSPEGFAAGRLRFLPTSGPSPCSVSSWSTAC